MNYNILFQLKTKGCESTHPSFSKVGLWEFFHQQETISSFISHSFTHYYKQLETERELSYKCLRKTYISSLSAALGIENARLITKHSGTQVMEEHYVDKKVIALTANNFEVFNQDEKRKSELEKVRNSNHEISLER